MFEEIGQLRLWRVLWRQIQAAHSLQVSLDAVRLSQLWIDSPQHSRLEQPSNDAGHFQSGLLPLGQLINSTQDQAVQAGRQVELF